jgi:hypothetical protein
MIPSGPRPVVARVQSFNDVGGSELVGPLVLVKHALEIGQEQDPRAAVALFRHPGQEQRSYACSLRPLLAREICDREKRTPVVCGPIVELWWHRRIGYTQSLEIVTSPTHGPPVQGFEVSEAIEANGLDLFGGSPTVHCSLERSILERRWQCPD